MRVKYIPFEKKNEYEKEVLKSNLSQRSSLTLTLFPLKPELNAFPYKTQSYNKDIMSFLEC